MRAKHSRQFRARLSAAKLKPDDLGKPGGLTKLPLLRRRDLQVPALQLYCAEVPRDHLPIGETHTSGSIGEPVVTRRTNITQFFWFAMVMRDHIWHGRDFGRRLASVRATVKEERSDDWGPPANLLFRTGPSLSIPSTANIKQMLEALTEFRPDNLLVYPNILGEMVRFCGERGRMPPSIRHVRTTGETLSPELRADAADLFRGTVEDCYSSWPCDSKRSRNRIPGFGSSMVGHDGFRRRIRLLEGRYGRRRVPPDAAEERRKRIAARPWICRQVREGLVRLGHDPAQCAMLVRCERMIAEELAAPPPPAPVRADPAARFHGKLAALVSRFGDPSRPPPDFSKESLMTVLAYVLARSPPPAEPAPAAAGGESRDSGAVG